MSSRLYLRGRIYWTWYYEPNGTRRDVSTRTRDRRSATAVARRLERSATQADATRNEATLTEACKRFLIDRENRGRSDETIRYYETKIGHLLRVLGIDKPLGDIRASDADHLISVRLAEGAGRSTVAKELGALGGVLRLAKRHGAFSGDVEQVLPEGWSAGGTPRSRSWTLDQARELVAGFRPDRAAHIAFLFVSGARLSPSHRAQRADIDLASGLIRVRGTKTKAAKRIVPIGEHVAEFARVAHDGAAPSGLAYAPWGNIRRDIARVCDRLKLPLGTPNDCRRSAATWLSERGAPSSTIAYFLGHTTSRLVEQVYGRIDGPKLATAFEASGIKIAAHLQREPAGEAV